MKLIRFGAFGKEKPGLHIDGINYDVSSLVNDYDEAFFENDGLNNLSKIVELQKGQLPAIPDGARLGSPVARPSKIVCIGLNYAIHAKETNAAVPKEPIIFLNQPPHCVGQMTISLSRKIL